MTKTRILLLDDHTIFRQALAKALSAEPDLELKLHCGSVGEALMIVAAGLVEFVLLDVDLGPERAIDFLAQARRNGFHGPVTILTAGLSRAEQESLERYGISGILQKDVSVEQLAQHIREIRLAAKMDFVVPIAKADNPRPLTRREADVLRCVVEGYANKEIAAQLGTSEAAIKSIMQHLFFKTGARSRSHLVRVALELLRDQF